MKPHLALDETPATNLDAIDPLTDEEDEDFEEESDDYATAPFCRAEKKIKK
jgi:protein CWC15